MSFNALSLAKIGIGFGALAIASIGLLSPAPRFTDKAFYVLDKAETSTVMQQTKHTSLLSSSQSSTIRQTTLRPVEVVQTGSAYYVQPAPRFTDKAFYVPGVITVTSQTKHTSLLSSSQSSTIRQTTLRPVYVTHQERPDHIAGTHVLPPDQVGNGAGNL